MKTKYFKTIIFILFITLISNTTNAQNISALDAKRGFKDFVLGDSFDDWSGQLTKHIDVGTIKYYVYKESESLKVFDYPVEKLVLGFNNNKLISIIIELGIWNKPTSPPNYTDTGKALREFATLITYFEALYGAPQTNKTSGNVEVSWVGKSTDLSAYLEYLGINKGSQVRVVVLDKNFLIQKLKDGF